MITKLQKKFINQNIKAYYLLKINKITTFYFKHPV